VSITGRAPGEQLCWSEPWMRFSARTPSRLGPHLYDQAFSATKLQANENDLAVELAPLVRLIEVLTAMLEPRLNGLAG